MAEVGKAPLRSLLRQATHPGRAALATGMSVTFLVASGLVLLALALTRAGESGRP